MRIERNTPEDSGDEEVTRGLRDIYASPSANASYWENLEARIMARIATAGEAPEWWGVFDGWVRVGLAAAVLAAKPAHGPWPLTQLHSQQREDRGQCL